MELPTIHYETPDAQELGLRATPPCPACAGLGWRWRVEDLTGATSRYREKCAPCRGTGKSSVSEVQRQVRDLTDWLQKMQVDLNVAIAMAKDMAMHETAHRLIAGRDSLASGYSFLHQAQQVMYKEGRKA